jgi:hypothetical protein
LLFPKFIYGFNPNESIVLYIQLYYKKIISTGSEAEPSKFQNSDDSGQIMEYLKKKKNLFEDRIFIA